MVALSGSSPASHGRDGVAQAIMPAARVRHDSRSNAIRSMVAGTTESRGTCVGTRAAANGSLPAQHVGGRKRTLVDAEAGAGIALRVEVDDQHALADGGQRGAEIDGGGGLADAALLIGERDDTRVRRGRSVHRAFAFRAWTKLG